MMDDKDVMLSDHSLGVKRATIAMRKMLAEGITIEELLAPYGFYDMDDLTAWCMIVGSPMVKDIWTSYAENDESLREKTPPANFLMGMAVMAKIIQDADAPKSS